jgi:hypothetical protein
MPDIRGLIYPGFIGYPQVDMSGLIANNELIHRFIHR